MESRANAVEYPFKCYAVDCIGSIDDILQLIVNSIKACDDFLSLLRARVSAEEMYAHKLDKAGGMPLFHYENGLLQSAFDQMKADVTHSAMQHQILASSINNDICPIIRSLKNQLQQRFSQMKNQRSDAEKELASLELSYRYSQNKFDGSYREACRLIAACLERGSKLPSLKADMFEATADGKIKPVNQSSRLRSPQPSKSHKPASTPEQMLSMLTGAGEVATDTLFAAAVRFQKGVNYGNYEISFSTPSKRAMTPLELEEAALVSMQQAEIDRFECRSKWTRLCVRSQQLSLKLQFMMSKFQGIQETFVQVMCDSLKKLVVFESSTVANIQYDIQMLFKKVESVDPVADISKWIDSRPKSTEVDKIVPYMCCWDAVALPLLPKLRGSINVHRCEVKEAASLIFDHHVDIGGSFKLVHLVPIEDDVEADHSLKRLIRPPSHQIVSSRMLQESLSECHYIVTDESLQPPSISKTEVAEQFLMPRLVRSNNTVRSTADELLHFESIDDGRIPYGSAHSVMEALAGLSGALIDKWNEAIDPYESIVKWRELIGASSGSNSLPLPDNDLKNDACLMTSGDFAALDSFLESCEDNTYTLTAGDFYKSVTIGTNAGTTEAEESPLFTLDGDGIKVHTANDNAFPVNLDESLQSLLHEDSEAY